MRDDWGYVKVLLFHLNSQLSFDVPFTGWGDGGILPRRVVYSLHREEKKMGTVEIVIPSRYQSTRLPGKPLVKIAGIEMIRRVAAIAEAVCRDQADCNYLVATDDRRILDFCGLHGIPAAMTSPECQSGTERCLAAASEISPEPNLIVNLQGDNPLCPPWVVSALIDAWRRDPSADVVTPCVLLSWEEYERMIEDKKTTPYSGTTVLVDRNNFALAFSKSTIPAVRDVEKAKHLLPMSPVRRHVGLYAYTMDALRRYMELGSSSYEPGYVEGLEQMRFLENGMRIKVVPVDYRGRRTTGGVDSPEDVLRVEEILGGE